MRAGCVSRCEACGLIQIVNGPPPGTLAKCARCRLALQRCKPDSHRRTLALALAALLLYLPANLLPILRAGYLGAHTQTRIFDGVQALFQKGNYLVAGLVFTTSIVTPGIQIAGLLVLCATLRWPGRERFRTWIYKIIQMSGPWNMMPVTLLAIAVSLIELGKVATVHPGPGAFSFAGMVIVTSCALLSFDPQLIWEQGGQTRMQMKDR